MVESQGYDQVTSPSEMIPKPKSKQGRNHVRKQREGMTGKRERAKSRLSHVDTFCSIAYCGKFAFCMSIQMGYFLLGKMCQGSKNIQELSQIFGSNKNEGCFGAQVSE